MARLIGFRSVFGRATSDASPAVSGVHAARVRDIVQADDGTTNWPTRDRRETRSAEIVKRHFLCAIPRVPRRVYENHPVRLRWHLGSRLHVTGIDTASGPSARPWQCWGATGAAPCRHSQRYQADQRPDWNRRRCRCCGANQPDPRRGEAAAVEPQAADVRWAARWRVVIDACRRCDSRHGTRCGDCGADPRR